MYRFNGEDGRLDRLLEIALMVMEAFNDDAAQQQEQQGPAAAGAPVEIEWAISGHSGDEAKLPLVDFGRPPRTRKVFSYIKWMR